MEMRHVAVTDSFCGCIFWEPFGEVYDEKKSRERSLLTHKDTCAALWDESRSKTLTKHLLEETNYNSSNKDNVQAGEILLGQKVFLSFLSQNM